MSIISGVQQNVFDPDIAYPGDTAGLPQYYVQGIGAVADSDLLVGSVCWGINNTKRVTQAQGANTQIAGMVSRNQATVIPYASTLLGASLVVSAGQGNVSVISSGNFYVQIAVSYNGGGVINVGDQVFINTTTGTLAVGVTIQTPFVAWPGFFVINNAVPASYASNLVLISNQNAFLG